MESAGLRSLGRGETRREDMRRVIVGLAALSVVAVTAGAYATQDPIMTRKALMDANGAAAGTGGAMLKGEVPFHAGVGKGVFVTMRGVAYAYGDYFPAGSDQGDTKASPKIWEDMAGFTAALQKFQQDVDAALAANPQDLEAFKAAFGTVTGNCKACHDVYRLPMN
jgi:cytochrome c556